MLGKPLSGSVENSVRIYGVHPRYRLGTPHECSELWVLYETLVDMIMDEVAGHGDPADIEIGY